MIKEKDIILNRIDELINKRKFELVKNFPLNHEIDDSIIINFFDDWVSYSESPAIVKHKKIANDPNDTTMFFYLPKGFFFDLKKLDHTSTMTCLTGKIRIDSNNNVVNKNTKITLVSDITQGVALENSYIITTNMI